ncbi:hypothetical protein M413DRAFT_274270 [Hebeloma cylindrosporum]|uniref:Uncharacterized protein n=1 Tax=Hebeloma cylindrosporum TaxID=76867 RepID=A0A0C3C164_HEBCY|nr:hypothetical protein M413DRAFT_274270 [Hebeloma cylindrosporum h7]
MRVRTQCSRPRTSSMPKVSLQTSKRPLIQGTKRAVRYSLSSASMPSDARTGLFLDRDSDLTEMRNSLIFSPQTHHNADSWSVFGDLCRRALERRAYEETDLVKRDEILESRAAACAMRSSAKSSKSAKTSSGSKGGDKKTSPQSHSVPKPLALGGALRSIPRGSVKKPAAKRPVAHGGAKGSAPARAGTKKLSPVGGVKKPASAGAAKKPAGRPTARPVPRKNGKK